jgi:ubiquitin-protein ligase
VFGNNPRKPFRPVEWHILKDISPFRTIIDNTQEVVLLHPKTEQGNYTEKYIMNSTRLQSEIFALKQDGYGEKQFRFLNIGTPSECLMFAMKTNSGAVYTLRIDIPSDYPNSIPAVYVTNPKPLRTKFGEPMLEPSPDMHTLSGKDGCVRICHFGVNSWSPRQTLAKVIMKCRIWLEVYESHLQTGVAIGYILKHDPNTGRRW